MVTGGSCSKRLGGSVVAFLRCLKYVRITSYRCKPKTERITSTVKYGIRIARSNHPNWWIPVNVSSNIPRISQAVADCAAKSAGIKPVGIKKAPKFKSHARGKTRPFGKLHHGNKSGKRLLQWNFPIHDESHH